MPPKSREHYAKDFKLKVIKRASEIGPLGASKEFNISLSNVNRWRKNEAKIVKLPKNGKIAHRRAAKWPTLENNLTDWIKNMRKEGHPVSTVLIRLKAKELAKEANIDDFTGNGAWCHRFMKRKKFSVRSKTSIGQKLPEGYELKVESFRNFTHSCVKSKNITNSNIWNMDEVPLTFDAPPARTVDTKGVKTVFLKTSGNEKTHFTVVLACSASGEKLKPMVIFKRKTLPKEETTAGVLVKTNIKGWMNTEVMLNWLSEIFNQREFPSEKALLVCDSMRAHISDEVKQRCETHNAHLAVIPGGLTKILQPLDITVNRVFKIEVRKQWELWMTQGLHTYTKTGRLRKATFAEVCKWVEVAWAAVKATTVVKAFQKAGIIPQATEVIASTSEDNNSDKNNECDSETGEESEDDPTPELDHAMGELFCSDSDSSGFEGFDSDECTE